MCTLVIEKNKNRKYDVWCRLIEYLNRKAHSASCCLYFLYSIPQMETTLHFGYEKKSCTNIEILFHLVDLFGMMIIKENGSLERHPWAEKSRLLIEISSCSFPCSSHILTHIHVLINSTDWCCLQFTSRWEELEQLESFVLMRHSRRLDNIFTQHAGWVDLIRLIIHSKYVFIHFSVFFHIHCFSPLSLSLPYFFWQYRTKLHEYGSRDFFLNIGRW